MPVTCLSRFLAALRHSHLPPLAVQEVEDVVFWSKIFLALGTGALLGLAGIEGWCVRCSPSIALLRPNFFAGKGLFYLLAQWLWRH